MAAAVARMQRRIVAMEGAFGVAKRGGASALVEYERLQRDLTRLGRATAEELLRLTERVAAAEAAVGVNTGGGGDAGGLGEAAAELQEALRAARRVPVRSGAPKLGSSSRRACVPAAAAGAASATRGIASRTRSATVAAAKLRPASAAASASQRGSGARGAGGAGAGSAGSAASPPFGGVAADSDEEALVSEIGAARLLVAEDERRRRALLHQAASLDDAQRRDLWESQRLQWEAQLLMHIGALRKAARDRGDPQGDFLAAPGAVDADALGGSAEAALLARVRSVEQARGDGHADTRSADTRGTLSFSLLRNNPRSPCTFLDEICPAPCVLPPAEARRALRLRSLVRLRKQRQRRRRWWEWRRPPPGCAGSGGARGRRARNRCAPAPPLCRPPPYPQTPCPRRMRRASC